jgi:ABC-2 type transport system ATP-binding protein
MSDSIIETAGLSKKFNHEFAVQDVDMEIPRGAVVGLIGPSGSGKTTTVRLLTGIYKPTTGIAFVLGQRPITFTRDLREKLGYMPQLFALYPELSVWENLNFAASIYGLPMHRGQRFDELLAFVELTKHKKKLARNLSGGMKRRLSLAATLTHSPELLFLDEPTAGIDPVLRRKFWDHFATLKAEGRTLFITTQYVGEAAYCDLVGVMVNGRLKMLETPSGLRRKAFGGEVVEMYTKERLLEKDLRALRTLPGVRGNIRRIGNSSNKGLRLVVDEAKKAIPALVAWCQQEYVTVESIEEYLPPFDDVFVELVKDEPEQ